MTDNIETIARDLRASLEQINIPDDFGWIHEAFQLRKAISLCSLAMETARAGDEQEAKRIVKGISVSNTNRPASEPLDKGFQETACWLWSQRRYRFEYRDGWFDATGVIIELNTTFADYCREIERMPSPDWCRRSDTEIWFTQSHLFQLVYFADPEFRKAISDAMKFMLHKSPARERHQAKLHSSCPEIHDAIFPDAVAGGH